MDVLHVYFVRQSKHRYKLNVGACSERVSRVSWFCAVRVAVCCVYCVSCLNDSLSFISKDNICKHVKPHIICGHTFSRS